MAPGFYWARIMCNKFHPKGEHLGEWEVVEVRESGYVMTCGCDYEVNHPGNVFGPKLNPPAGAYNGAC